MTDIVDSKTRSRMMSGIKGKNTKPEVKIRKALFAKGLRYRLHEKKLPGRPDLVFPKYRAVVFVNGCFWHGHGCSRFKWPSTNTNFWKTKITRNKSRDLESAKKLKELGWRVLTVWECATRGPNRWDWHNLIDEITAWIESGPQSKDIFEKQ